jgi:SulP family sulfate permease
VADATALLAGFNSRAGLHALVLPIGIVHGLGRLAPSGVVPFPSMTRMMAATIGQVAKDGTDGYAVASLIARSGADPAAGCR